MPINIMNPKGRDAVVALEGVAPKREVRYVDDKGKPVMTRKLLKTDVTHDLPELLKKAKKIEKVADALIKGDPEIDIEQFGMYLTDTSRVYVTKAGIVHLVEEADNDAGVGAGQANDQRETHAGPLDRTGNQVGPGIAYPDHLWRDQSLSPIEQLRHLVASRADDRLGTVEHLPGISSQQLLQILQALRILVGIGDQVENDPVGM